MPPPPPPPSSSPSEENSSSSSAATSRSTTLASALPYPSALASRALHLPSGASIAAAANSPLARALMGALTPATSARVAERARSPEAATCAAASDEEQAVSSVRHGPRREWT